MTFLTVTRYANNSLMCMNEIMTGMKALAVLAV